MFGYHFLKEDRCLSNGDGRLVEPGSLFATSEIPVLCKVGFHASEKPLDALTYAPGPVICRVHLNSRITHDGDKMVAQERKVIWMANITAELHEFACQCAEDALKNAEIADPLLWGAVEAKRKWLKGEVTDQQLNAAWSAAQDAAWSAAQDAAWSAAQNVAWSAAQDAAWSAAWSAARSAARTKQDIELRKILDKVVKEEG